MRQTRKIIWIGSVGLALFLALLFLPGIRQANGSQYSRQVEEDLFSLGMERLNGTIAEPFSLKEGDTIDVSVVRISGRLSISIGQENREPIYEGTNPELGSFRVTVPEDGVYLLSVSGKQAEGSISFQINRTSDQPSIHRAGESPSPVDVSYL